MTDPVPALAPGDHDTEVVRLVADAIEDAPWPCEHSNPTSTDPCDWWTCSACRATAAMSVLIGAGWQPAEPRGHP